MVRDLPEDDGRSMRERLLAGDLYRGDEEIERELRRAERLAHAYNLLDPGDPDVDARRRALLGELLGSVGEGTSLRAPIRFDLGHRTTIGERSFVNAGLICLDIGPVTIGDDVLIGPGVQLLTPTHPADAELRRAGWESSEPIAIGDGVWIGGGAIVLPGVAIGPRAVVGAGAVVTRDVPADATVAGNPARPLRR